MLSLFGRIIIYNLMLSNVFESIFIFSPNLLYFMISFFFHRFQLCLKLKIIHSQIIDDILKRILITIEVMNLIYLLLLLLNVVTQSSYNFIFRSDLFFFRFKLLYMFLFIGSKLWNFILNSLNDIIFVYLISISHLIKFLFNYFIYGVKHTFRNFNDLRLRFSA